MVTRLLFIGLWTVADRDGRLEDKPKKIKMAVFPADSVDVDACLSELQTSGFLLRYEVDGSRYIQVLNFKKHQNPHRDEKASSIPAPPEHGVSTVQKQDKQEANTMQEPCQDAVSPADSLIPDSLIPESFNPINSKAVREPEKKSPVGDAENDFPEMDDKAIIFSMGVPALVKLGATEKSAKGLVGKCIKEAGLDGAMKIVGRMSAFNEHPNPAALMMLLLAEEKDPVLQDLRERHGDHVRKLAKGYSVNGRTFDSAGKQEVSL